MLAVLDTNVLLSALRSGVTSIEQIAEFKRAARYPKLRPYLPRAAIGRLVNEDSPDPGDDYLLAMALAAGADYLVTGDGVLLALKRLGRTHVVTAARFASLHGR